MVCQPMAQRIEHWPIDKLVFYARNPRKNDAAVDRMCSSIREFGFKIPVLARSDGEVVDGHLRLKAARKLGITEVPVVLCDEWTPAQVKAFRLMVNRSVTWAAWNEDLLALELQELKESDFDLDLTGFDPGEIDGLLALEDEEIANAAPPLPETPVSRPGDLCFRARGVSPEHSVRHWSIFEQPCITSQTSNRPSSPSRGGTKPRKFSINIKRPMISSRPALDGDTPVVLCMRQSVLCEWLQTIGGGCALIPAFASNRERPHRSTRIRRVSA